MTFALLAALTIETLAFLWVLNGKDERHRDEVQTLCQRIQAPEVAVIEHASRHAEPDDPYPMDDGEQLEEEQRLAIERMERLEAEAAPWLS